VIQSEETEARDDRLLGIAQGAKSSVDRLVTLVVVGGFFVVLLSGFGLFMSLRSVERVAAETGEHRARTNEVKDAAWAADEAYRGVTLKLDALMERVEKLETSQEDKP